MNSQGRFRSIRDLREIAGAESSKILPDETTETVPVPVGSGGELRFLIMYFKERGDLLHHRVLPPHHAMYLDGPTGKILQFGPISAAELGITRPDATVAGVGMQPSISAEDAWRKRERLFDLSDILVPAYSVGVAATDPKFQPLAKEYWELFSERTPEKVVPFYLQAAPDFFGWIRTALRSTSAPLQHK
jgi:hypothetical protein